MRVAQEKSGSIFRYRCVPATSFGIRSVLFPSRCFRPNPLVHFRRGNLHMHIDINPACNPLKKNIQDERCFSRTEPSFQSALCSDIMHGASQIPSQCFHIRPSSSQLLQQLSILFLVNGRKSHHSITDSFVIELIGSFKSLSVTPGG